MLLFAGIMFDMEKISFLPNGQWNLEKSRKKGDTSIGPYNIDHTNPEHRYEGEDLHAMRTHTIKTASQQKHKALKMDINPKTNKEEPHIMLHRGMPDSQKSMDSKRLGNQKFEVTDEHVNHEGTGVHTAVYDVAHEYSSGYKGGDGKAEVHSFWVPISDIIDNISFNNDGKEKANMHGDHIVVGPGKYKKISEEEKKNMHESMKVKPSSKDHIDAHKFRSKIASLAGDKHENYSKKISEFSPETIAELAEYNSNPKVHDALANDEDFRTQLIEHIKGMK